MRCCCPSPLSNGQPPAAGGSELAFDVEITTTDGAVQTVTLAQLPVAGAAAHANLELVGQQDNPAGQEGQRGAWTLQNASAARNSVGSGSFPHIALQAGYTDIATPAWTTGGAAWPAGWGFTQPGVVGNAFVMTFNGAAGQRVRWRLFGTVVLENGATP